MKKYILGLVAAVCFATTASAQVEACGGVDLVSSYNWRGMQQSGPALQPGMEMSVGGFSLGAWGSSSFDAFATTTKELDFYLGYSIGGFSIAVTDYWWSGEDQLYLDDNMHQQEVTLGYDFEFGLSVAWSTMLAGTLDQDENGDQYYSSYLSLGYSCAIAETIGCDFTLGINPWESQWGDMGLSSLAVRFSKDLLDSETFTLPFFVEASVSQVQKNAYLVAGLSFGF